MVYFNCDYQTGAHPEVLEALVRSNFEFAQGYGYDKATATAKKLIMKACGLTKGDVYLLTGGTQTNMVVLDRLLGRGEGVLCTETAHIYVHESGAIEAAGHKVIALPVHDGKLMARDVKEYLDKFYADDTWRHMSRPGAVYISHPTELGTLYTQKELTELSEVCRAARLPLYLDGARMAYGLMAPGAELSLKDIASLCDIFYIGGTKCGTLLGEAVVSGNKKLLDGFLTHAKSHGALLAKGRVLGIQFCALFSNDLYRRIGAHAIKLAMEIRNGFLERGYLLYIDSPTNQQFVLLPNRVLDALRKKVSFELWGPRQAEETPVRFVTSWSTTEEDVRTLFHALDHLPEECFSAE